MNYTKNRTAVPVPVDTTSILTGYVVPCNGTVIAWEFCYQIDSAPSMSIFPGIWRITEKNDYVLVQSNKITYDPRGTPSNLFLCKKFILSNTEQFIAQAGSVVGLYTGNGQVLHSSKNDSITTYQVLRNQTSVSSTSSDNVNYSIAIRVHLGKYAVQQIMQIYMVDGWMYVHMYAFIIIIHMQETKLSRFYL